MNVRVTCVYKRHVCTREIYLLEKCIIREVCKISSPAV